IGGIVATGLRSPRDAWRGDPQFLLRPSRIAGADSLQSLPFHVAQTPDPPRRDFPGGKVIPIRYNLRSIMVRRATAAMTASVVALVVMLLFILSGFVAGLRATVMQNALPDNWIVLSRGTTDEGGSFISREQYEIIKSRPQIAAAPGGYALVSPEVITGFNPVPDAEPSSAMFTLLRGV